MPSLPVSNYSTIHPHTLPMRQTAQGLLKRHSDWQQAPTPDESRAWALERHSGNTLFSSFLGRGGEEEKDVCGALFHSFIALAIKLAHRYNGHKQRAGKQSIHNRRYSCYERSLRATTPHSECHHKNRRICQQVTTHVRQGRGDARISCPLPSYHWRGCICHAARLQR